jgi:adenosylhomocysteine nucleosidase
VTQQNSGGVVILFALEREAAPFRRAARELCLTQARSASEGKAISCSRFGPVSNQTAGSIEQIHIHVTGVGRRRTQVAMEQILIESDSPRCIIAAGFCGALQPKLRVGDIVIAREVVDVAGHMWPTHSVLIPQDKQCGRILTANGLIANSAEKRQLGDFHKADAVDMESAAVAEASSARGVPFLAVRAVSDAVDTELSPELLRLLSGGNVSAWKAFRALLKKPALMGEFRRLARDTRLAARNLAKALLNIIQLQ